MPAVPTYLMCRNGVWYLNYRIPTFLRQRYNLSKRFVRKSLRTKNVHEAILLSQQYTSWLIMSKKKQDAGLSKLRALIKMRDRNKEVRKLELEQELYTDALLIGRKILSAYEDVMQNGTYVEQEDFWLEYSEYEFECYRLAVDEAHQQQKEREKQEEKQARKKAKFFADEVRSSLGQSIQGQGIIGNNKQKQETSITLNELFEKFIEYKISNRAWKPRTLRLNKGRLNLIKEFLEYVIGMKNPMIHQFTSEHAIRFEEEFCRYPKNAKKKFPNMTLADIMSKIDTSEFAEVERISTNNYNEYAQLLMAVFSWAKEDKKRKYLKGENVFVDLKKTGEPPKSYSPFEIEELKLFFSSDLFQKKKFETKFAWRYWIPIIMMYHGMRLEEVSQLLIKNIMQQDEVWCFDIKDELDNEGQILTTTKKRGNQTGERVVPIHSKVIGIGFLDYVEYQKSRQKDVANPKLFPTLNNIDQKGNYKQAGSAVSAWFNEDSKKQGKSSYFSKVGIDKKERHLALYSFKHTAETLLINHPDKIEHDKIDTVIGHLVKSTGRKHYGRYNQRTLLEDVVEKIDYPEAELPWDINKNYNDIPFPWE